MDLSICLPLYQQKPYAAVDKLKVQADNLHVDYEILIIDDASDPAISKENTRHFSAFPTVRYLVLPANIGRAKMRNRLAAEAKGKFMLCLDSDLIIENHKFLQNYWEQRNNALVLVGGRKTSALIKGCELRYYYALQREEKSLGQRQEKPYSSFMTGNFFCNKAIFDRLQFDEALKGYGHEDTLFGFGLEALKIPLLQLENPVIFAADDTNKVFLKKTKEAINNLHILHRKYPEWSTKLRILDFALKIEKKNAKRLFIYAYRPFKKLISKNLQSKKPKLFFYDLYRLYYLLRH